MIRIGVELNHVVRDVNRQIAKYYAKANGKEFDSDEFDSGVDVFENYARFEEKMDKHDFLYIDYPYEVFGCAPVMDKGLAVRITTWLKELENIEDDEVQVFFYSLDEGELTIQSTYFFLSKIGTRVRKIIFPKDARELINECDVIVSARREIFESDDFKGLTKVLIRRKFNEKCENYADYAYDTLTDFINDGEFVTKLLEEDKD